MYTLYAGEGHGNPLQYSCLENPLDRGAWWATVHRVMKRRTQLSNYTQVHCSWTLSCLLVIYVSLSVFFLIHIYVISHWISFSWSETHRPACLCGCQTCSIFSFDFTIISTDYKTVSFLCGYIHQSFCFWFGVYVFLNKNATILKFFLFSF